ncbi:coiled-coil domain-containing protein 150 [Rhinophrynus dorsalis]
MARPVISPFTIHPTAPETFSVLQQRMHVAEEQAESLISNLQALCVSSQRFEKVELEYQKPSDVLHPISPVRARTVFTGDNDTLWKNCENLINRMCRVESIMQTLKLSIFRLHTERKLNPKHTAEVEQRLSEVQEEHSRELREAQLEVMRLRQRLSKETEEREREEEAKERLSAALEIATATKTDVTVAAEEMKATKLRMNQRLRELQEQLSEETVLRTLLEEEQAATLSRVQEMKQVVEEERAQVQKLQQDCQILREDGQKVKYKLQQQEEKMQYLEQETMQLHSELESKDFFINQLQEEAKRTQQCRDTEKTEVALVRADYAALREAAEKVQALNQQLEGQCSELTAAVQRLTTENAQLVVQHQQELKVEQESMARKLQDQEILLSATRASLTSELHNLQSHRIQLERELELLRAEHSECQRKAVHEEQKSAVQREIQDSTIARLREDLDLALKNKATSENDRNSLQDKLDKALSDFQEKKQNLEVELTEKKLELDSVQSTLRALEQENKRLMERVGALEQEQNPRMQVEVLLNDLMDSKNKLAYEKGNLQSTVDKLQSELQSVGDAQSENAQLRKLNTALEAKYTQVNTDLGSCRIHLQRMETKLRQTQTILLRKDEDFALAVQARDEASREEKRLRGLMEVAEEREKQNRTSLQQQLCDIQEERSRMSVTLESVLSSNNRLQQDLENLQTELGHRDCDIAALHKERRDCTVCSEAIQIRVLAQQGLDIWLCDQHLYKAIAAARVQALAWVTPLLDSQSPLISDFEAFHVTFLFDTPRLQAKAEATLLDLQQCSHTFAQYAIEFCTLIEPLQKTIEMVREDNRTLAHTLQQALQKSCKLQSRVSDLEKELLSKEVQEQQLHTLRTQAEEDTKTQAQLCEERVASLKKQHKMELEASKRSARTEMAEAWFADLLSLSIQEPFHLPLRPDLLAQGSIWYQDVDRLALTSGLLEANILRLNGFSENVFSTMVQLKKALDNATAKSAELSRTNRGLRSRESALEKNTLQQKDQIRRLKIQLRSHIESKANSKQADEVKEIESELKHMEKVKEEYEKRSKEQSQRIEEFLAEITSLREEMVAMSQKTEECVLRDQLENETQLRKELEKRCKSLEQRVGELQVEKEITEQKLREASVESEQISNNLEEAHSWFQSRFEELQLELVKNRQNKCNRSPKSDPEEVFTMSQATELLLVRPKSAKGRIRPAPVHYALPVEPETSGTLIVKKTLRHFPGIQEPSNSKHETLNHLSGIEEEINPKPSLHKHTSCIQHPRNSKPGTPSHTRNSQETHNLKYDAPSHFSGKQRLHYVKSETPNRFSVIHGSDQFKYEALNIHSSIHQSHNSKPETSHIAKMHGPQPSDGSLLFMKEELCFHHHHGSYQWQPFNTSLQKQKMINSLELQNPHPQLNIQRNKNSWKPGQTQINKTMRITDGGDSQSCPKSLVAHNLNRYPVLPAIGQHGSEY